MLSTLLVLGCVCVAARAGPGSGCREDEYRTGDGLCCPMCHKGTFVGRECTSESGTRCSPCANGTFMSHPSGLSRCFLCTSCAPAHGLFALRKCTATADTVCHVLNGYFCKHFASDTGCSMAEWHTRCAPGQRTKHPGTNTSDTVCEDCQPGYFSRDGLNCTPWTICSETQTLLKEGGPISDAVCGSAERNRSLLFAPFLLFVSVTVSVLVTRSCPCLCIRS